MKVLLVQVRSFDESIISGKITITQVDEDQSNLLEKEGEFSNKFRPRTEEGKTKKGNILIVLKSRISS